MSLFPPAACPRLIVKIGSALLVDPDGAVRRDWLAGIAADIAARTKAGQQVAVVSSGAIGVDKQRSEEHTSELQSLNRISYSVFCLKKKTTERNQRTLQLLYA